MVAVSGTVQSELPLGTPRLTVRDGAGPSSAGLSPFAQSLDYEKLPLTGGVEWRNVSADKSRRIETVADATDAHAEYVEEKKNAVLVLEEQNSGDVRVLPYAHRWTQEYRDMVYAKLKDAEAHLSSTFGEGPIPTTMVTLTVNPRDEQGNPRPLGAVLDDLLDGWGKFRRVIRRATEGWKTEVFRIVEPQQSGYPHIHAMIFGVAKPSLQKKVRELWVEKYGVGGQMAHEQAVEVMHGRAAQVTNPAAYLMKYLSKTVVRSNGEQQQVDGFAAFAALLWVTGKRQYSMTQGLSAAMKSPGGGLGDSQEWRFVGVGHGFKPGGYSGDVARDLIAHMTRHVWRPPPSSTIPNPFPGVNLQRFSK